MGHDISLKNAYERSKCQLLSDQKTDVGNLKIFSEFLEFEEYKLKRINSVQSIDIRSYKTLYKYIQMLKNVNFWFNNKSWYDLTKEDIKIVYDALEDGKLKNKKGNVIQSRRDYYVKIFKGKPFRVAGKDGIAKEVIEFYIHRKKDVKFITEDDFRKIVDNVKQKHKLLLWLAWDIGENINSLLELKKRDFYLEKNPNTKDPEYRVNLKKEILKRSRRPRSEITNYKETVELLNQRLSELNDDDKLFSFEYAYSKKIIDRAVQKAKVKCIPNGEKVTWKDLRSGMACDLLKKGYTSDEVNARLGHSPSSDEIDKYINFLAIDRHTPKNKVHQYEMEKVTYELEEIKRREKLHTQRNETLQEQVELQERKIKEMMELLKAIDLERKVIQNPSQ